MINESPSIAELLSKGGGFEKISSYVAQQMIALPMKEEINAAMSQYRT
jgi:hypothetical protein